MANKTLKNEMVKTYNKLSKAYNEAKNEIDLMVEKEYPQGLIMRWKDGKYAGRQCIVRKNTWDVDSYGNLEIQLVVATESLKGGFINDNDSYHRRYRKADHYFENINKGFANGK